MAQLDEMARGCILLRAAAQGFGKGESIAGARCAVAEAEIALVSRGLAWSAERLDTAHRVLERRGDTAGAAHAHIIGARRYLLLDHLDLALQHLKPLDRAALRSALLANFDLVLAGIDLRRLRPSAARKALEWTEVAATNANMAGLIAEVESARRSLEGRWPCCATREATRSLPWGVNCRWGAISGDDAMVSSPGDLHALLTVARLMT